MEMDIVKMIAMVHSIEGDELEYFRSAIKGEYSPSSSSSSSSSSSNSTQSTPLVSAVNMGPMGQLSRAFNTVFSPVTHPLLPMIAAPGQLTAAEINQALHIMGQLPGHVRRRLVAVHAAVPVCRKCFNELDLPHSFTPIDHYHYRLEAET